MTKLPVSKIILASLICFDVVSAYGQTRENDQAPLIAEKISPGKIKGKYVRYELLCSRTFRIKASHRIHYKGGCEANKDTKKSGRWTIENDTLIITKLFGEQQKWILVNGCLYNITSSGSNQVACRSSSAQ